MNFYEAARFQYSAARLMVKLAQFRQTGRFVKKITNKSNFNILLKSQTDGSFNINVEEPEQEASKDNFIDISIADLIAYVSERVIEKIDEGARASVPGSLASLLPTSALGGDESVLDKLAQAAIADDNFVATLPWQVQDLVKRRVSEFYREQRMLEKKDALAKIDFARSQKLIAMSAPLLSDMATALRRSADTLEVTSSKSGTSRPLLFLDQDMAQEIETAIVDDEITPILGDITQFNKDNGWGKLKIEDGTKTVSFSIPSDILPTMKQILIDNMKRDLVYLQVYFVRDRSGEIVRMIPVGIIPTPTR
ncbi:hypothetical protein V7S57_16745 [Caulobacter sp. CCNWLY153]|uniref:hypothetical protein n=1 Tax=unclassified Caulobacter TaxID=2648921 RepID=UPI002FEF2A90